MKLFGLSKERMKDLNSEINEFSYDACCRAYDFMKNCNFPIFETNQIIESRPMIFFMDEKGTVLNFNLIFPEIIYVGLSLGKRIARLDGNAEEYERLKKEIRNRIYTKRERRNRHEK